MYSKETKNIKVTVEPVYLPAQSEPEANKFVWAYQVRIENKSAQTVQLKTRTWFLTDANGHTEMVNGAGVVGVEPVLEPGDWFEYVSGAPLHTPSGMMVGRYGMISKLADGQTTSFEVDIPAFSLDSPHQKTLLN